MRFTAFITLVIIFRVWVCVGFIAIDNSFHKCEKFQPQAENEDSTASAVWDSTKASAFKEYLLQLGESKVQWISRKEIAAWSATILYLSVILFLLRKMEDVHKKNLWSITSLLAFLILTILFIHQQYGQMANAIATRKTVIRYSYLISIEDSSLRKIDLETMSANRVVPEFIQGEIKLQEKKLRCLCWFQRIFLPTYKIFSRLKGDKETIQTVEVEEGVLYDMIILAFIFMWGTLYYEDFRRLFLRFVDVFKI